MSEPYDVVVVGAGVVGAAIAWRLAADGVSVLWLEASHDVCEGASKANSGIACSGYDCPPGTQETELVLKSSPRWEQICADLDVPFKRIGELVLAFTDEEEARLPALAKEAAKNGILTEIVTGEEARQLAPAASPDALAALHVPSEAIIDPIRLTIGYAEAAVRNGADLRLSAPATGFRHNSAGALTHVVTPNETFAVRYAVNAAGLFADEVSSLAGGENYRIWPRKGQFLLVDREVGQWVSKILVPVPSEQTRGILAIPTTNRGVLLGPTAEDQDDKFDDATDPDVLERVFTQAKRLIPGVERSHVIKTFAGLRPASDMVYRVAQSTRVSNLVHAAGIRSTGVSSSPAVADRVRCILQEAGLEGPRNFRPVVRLPRTPRLAETPSERIGNLVERDPGYGVVVCACEHVSAAEIRASLTSAVPATSLDAVRKRTRASGGRCQGCYCLAGVGFMLSMAQDYEPWEVPRGKPGSHWGIPPTSEGSEHADPAQAQERSRPKAERR